MTDEAIIRRFGETGDPRWFEMLIARHRDYVQGVVMRLVFDAEDASDLTQEIFVKAYFSLPRFRSEATFRTWLHRIAVNHCLNHLSRRSQPTAEAVPFSGEPSQGSDDPELRLHVQSCLERLEASDRVLLVLKYVEDLDHTEICEMLSISVSASKMRLKRAKDRFLRLYHGDAYE